VRVRQLSPPPEVSRETFEETTVLREGEMITAETNTTDTKNPPGAAVPAIEENLKVDGREVAEEAGIRGNEVARQIVSPLRVRHLETAEVRNFCQVAGREEEIETHPLIAIAEDQNRDLVRAKIRILMTYV